MTDPATPLAPSTSIEIFEAPAAIRDAMASINLSIANSDPSIRDIGVYVFCDTVPFCQDVATAVAARDSRWNFGLGNSYFSLTGPLTGGGFVYRVPKAAELSTYFFTALIWHFDSRDRSNCRLLDKKTIMFKLIA